MKETSSLIEIITDVEHRIGLKTCLSSSFRPLMETLNEQYGDRGFAKIKEKLRKHSKKLSLPDREEL